MTQASGRARELAIGGRSLVWGARTYVMGILNVSPDSFSGDGVSGDPAGLRDRIEQLVSQEPDVVDVGGESTRPGATEVPAAEEMERVLPAIAAIRACTDTPVSIDTRKAAVAEAAIKAGAQAINDVTGGAHDPDILSVAAQNSVPIVLTHNRRARAVRSALGGHYADAHYDDLVSDVLTDLRAALDAAARAGVSSEAIVIDPGFGFGKTPDQNLELLRRLAEVRRLGMPILVGMSRKSFVGHVVNLPADRRLEGSLAAAVIAVANGADIVRAHDVAATKRAVAVADAIYRHR